MKVAVQLTFALVSFALLQPAWCSDAIFAAHEECIEEPVFKGKVCTVQANLNSRNGVILIHGLGGSIDDWRHTIPALATDFHVVAFDLPGFGRSDKGSQVYSPVRYAHLVQFLADRYFQNKSYDVVGHSMGGAIALRYASLRPQRFRRLVLIDAAGILHPQAISKFQAGSMLERNSGVPQTRGFAERLSGKLLEQVAKLPVSPSDIVNSSLGRDYVLQGGPDRIAALQLAGEDFTDAIAAVTEPTLIVWGDHDLVAPLRTGKVLAARMPHARLVIIDGSGHEPMQDQTEQLNALVMSHLLIDDGALSGQFQTAPRRQALISERVGTCSGESGKVFEGDYYAIKLRDCSDAVIRNARVVQLTVLNSRLDMTDTDVMGKEEGLSADNSEVTITNGSISGVVAIKAVRSRLDLAGVHLQGSQDAVRGVNSKFVFSVSRVSSPQTEGSLHTFKSMVDATL